MPVITLHFIDGTAQSFEVPKPTDHVQARRTRLDMVLEGRFVIVEVGSVEETVLFFPVENIKCIQVDGSAPGLELPPYSMRGARRIGDS